MRSRQRATLVWRRIIRGNPSMRAAASANSAVLCAGVARAETYSARAELNMLEEIVMVVRFERAVKFHDRLDGLLRLRRADHAHGPDAPTPSDPRGAA
jgi:hypothetical protein